MTKGETAKFEHTANSGNQRCKEFCPRCGSQLFSYTVDRDLTSIKVGSIDDASFVEPGINLFCSRALGFAHITDATKNFDEMPG